MPDLARRGYIRRDKIEVASGRRLGSVYVPLRSSLEDFIGALEHASGDCAYSCDISVDARVLATYITRPRLGDVRPLADPRIGLVLNAEGFSALPSRVIAGLVDARIILDLPASVLPWGLLADSPTIDELRFGPEFASRAGRAEVLPLLRQVVSQFVSRVSLSVPTRDWMAGPLLESLQEAGIHALECPSLSDSTRNPPKGPKVIRGPFDVIHDEPYRFS